MHFIVKLLEKKKYIKEISPRQDPEILARLGKVPDLGSNLDHLLPNIIIENNRLE